MTQDARRIAPAAARNRQPILDVLRPHLPARGVVLEIASGSGEHILHFARSIGGPELMFQPSDPDPAARASIDAWTATEAVPNVRAAIALDAAATDWPIERADAVVCINMILISPWTASIGLMRGAARILTPGSVLYLYGPFHRDGRPTAPSNAEFDRDLRRRNPLWGIRDLEAVVALAAEHGFGAPQIEEMPANNLSVVLRRQAEGAMAS